MNPISKLSFSEYPIFSLDVDEEISLENHSIDIEEMEEANEANLENLLGKRAISPENPFLNRSPFLSFFIDNSFAAAKKQKIGKYREEASRIRENLQSFMQGSSSSFSLVLPNRESFTMTSIAPEVESGHFSNVYKITLDHWKEASDVVMALKIPKSVFDKKEERALDEAIRAEISQYAPNSKILREMGVLFARNYVLEWAEDSIECGYQLLEYIPDSFITDSGDFDLDLIKIFEYAIDSKDSIVLDLHPKNVKKKDGSCYLLEINHPGDDDIFVLFSAIIESFFSVESVEANPIRKENLKRLVALWEMWLKMNQIFDGCESYPMIRQKFNLNE